MGDIWSSLTFCVALKAALVQLKSALAKESLFWKILAYIDDILLILHRSLLCYAIRILTEALATLGLRLQHEKCSVLIPEVTTEVAPEITESGLTPAWGTLKLLGSDLHDDVETLLVSAGSPSLPSATEKRQAVCLKMLQKLHGMLSEVVEDRPSGLAVLGLLKNIRPAHYGL